MKRRLIGHRGPVYRCIFSSDGSYVLTAGQDRTVRLWNPHKASVDYDAPKDAALLVHSYEGAHGYEAVDVAVSMDNSKFVSCGGDKCCFVFDVATGKNVRKLFGHEQRLNAVALKRKDATILATASFDATVRLWDLRQYGHRSPCIQILKDSLDSVSCVTCCDEEIIASSLDGCVRIYDIRAGKMLEDSITNADSDEKAGGVSWVTVSNDDKCLLLSCLANPAQLCLLEKESGKKLQTYSGHWNVSYRLASCFDNDDSTVFSGSEEGYIYRWDLVSGKLINKFQQIHTRAVSSVNFHPKRNSLVSSSYDSSCIYQEI